MNGGNDTFLRSTTIIMRYYNNKGNGVTVCDASQAGGSVLIPNGIGVSGNCAKPKLPPDEFMGAGVGATSNRGCHVSCV
jgi:hypothetical protein